MNGGLNNNLHPVCDQHALLLTEGQVSHDKGAATVLAAMPVTPVLIADRSYDAD